MPTNRRHRLNPRRRDIVQLDDEVQRILLYGQGFFETQEPVSDETLQAAWTMHRDHLREKWQNEEAPGTRCFGEWLYELTPKYGERRVTEGWSEEHERHRAKHLIRGILHMTTIPPVQESEAEYLSL